jgi:DNA-binding MarR family transcriptional regulator
MNEPCDDSTQTSTIGRLFFRFVRANVELNEVTARCAAGLTTQQANACLYLIERDGVTVRELAEGMGVTAGWASRLVDDLVEAGHVLRERDAADRRNVRLNLAPSTRDEMIQMAELRNSAVERALAELSNDEVETFTGVLARIADEFEQLVAEERARL